MVCLFFFSNSFSYCYETQISIIFSVKMSEQKFEIESPQGKLFDCYICQQKFDQYTLEVHFVTVHNNVQNENLNKCEICDNIFENKINLSRHIKNVHNYRENGYKCNICTKIFKLTVIGSFCNACKIKFETTRPSFICILGP